MTTRADLIERGVISPPRWIISDHAWVRWRQRWATFDMMAELNAAKVLGRAQSKRLRAYLPTGRSPRQVYLRSPCGAVFVLAKDDLRTVVTVLPPVVL